MRCDSCQKQYCTTCTGMKNSVHTAMSTTENAHWFCDPYNSPAMSLNAAERSMKEACENYMEGVSSKLKEFENNLITKANITAVGELSKMFEELPIKVENLKRET